jgi:hypothetical protein
MEHKKPIVFIDLLSALARWENEDPDPLNQQSIQPTEYFSNTFKHTVKISSPNLYHTNNHYDKERKVESDYLARTLIVLSKYQELLKELRETCQVRLISSTDQKTTLAINSSLNLGFDRREIITKEDVPTNDLDYIYQSNQICPECLLISNKNPESKISVSQRKALGIEKEQQVKTSMLDIKCLEDIQKQNPCKPTVNELTTELDTGSRSRVKKPYLENSYDLY